MTMNFPAFAAPTPAPAVTPAPVDTVNDGVPVTVVEWLGDNAASGNAFIASLWTQWCRKKSLSPKQLVAIEKMMAGKNKRPSWVIEVQTDALFAAFAKAAAAGLIKRRLTVFGYAFTEAKETSQNRGFIYVKNDGDYLGKIGPGEFHPIRDCVDRHKAKIAELLADFDEQLIASGLETGICSCCGAQLTNPDSIARGIGPICAEKWM